VTWDRPSAVAEGISAFQQGSLYLRVGGSYIRILRSDSAVLGNRQFVTLIFTVVQPIKSGEQGNFRADQRSERQVWGQSFVFIDLWSSDRSAPKD
jgi:hypothetical protein